MRRIVKKTLIYITHARIPSEKTPSPFILKTCEQFAARGYTVELWAAGRRNPAFAGIDPFEHHGISRTFSMTRIPVLDTVGFLGPVGFGIMVLSFNVAVFFKLFRRSDVIVYGHDLRDLLLPTLLGPSVYCEIHDFYESSLPLSSFVIRRLRGLIVTNRLKIASLKEKYGVSDEHILLQRNAVDDVFLRVSESKSEARAALHFPEGSIALYTGHLYPWKGVYVLAAAAAHLPPEVTLYFVGGTDTDRAVLKRFVAKNNLPRIVFVPHQDHARIPLYQRAADVLVLPNSGAEAASKYETSPVKLFEYLTVGTPIVASDLPSIRDIVSESEVTYAKPDDPRDLARAIIEALGKPAAAPPALDSWESRGRAITAFIERT